MTSLLFFLMRAAGYPMESTAGIYWWLQAKWESRVNRYWSEHPEERQRLVDALEKEFATLTLPERRDAR